MVLKATHLEVVDNGGDEFLGEACLCLLLLLGHVGQVPLLFPRGERRVLPCTLVLFVHILAERLVQVWPNDNEDVFHLCNHGLGRCWEQVLPWDLELQGAHIA